MTDKLFENNQVSFQFSHEVFGEGFYMVELAVNRLSNYSDYIPLMISERLIDTVLFCAKSGINVFRIVYAFTVDQYFNISFLIKIKVPCKFF